jgi:hypothetical protein
MNEITEINVNGSSLTDKTQMAEEFNLFFSCIGKHISDSVPASSIDPLSFINTPVDVPTLEFHHCHLGQIIELVKNFENKPSPDLDGISISLLSKLYWKYPYLLPTFLHSALI